MVSKDLLTTFSFFEGFSDEELKTLAEITTIKSASNKEFIFHEGDDADELFFIKKGQIQILKKTLNENTYEEINIRREGDILGEIAFLDGSTRSATIRAIGGVELLSLKKSELQKLPPAFLSIEKNLVYQIALTVTQRLRAETETVNQSFQNERKMRQTQYEFGQFFVYILICYAAGMLVNHTLYTRFPELNIYSSTFAWSYLLILMLPGIFLVWKLKIPWARVGITFSDWKESVKEGLLASIILISVFVAILFLSRLTGVVDSTSFKYDILTKPQYLLHSYGQEFLARGLLQNTLQRFFNDTKGIRSVAISSFLFSLLHIHFGLAAVALTFFSSLALGYFYLRHQSLLGVTILHWSMGVCAFVTGLL